MKSNGSVSILPYFEALVNELPYWARTGYPIRGQGPTVEAINKVREALQEYDEKKISGKAKAY